MLKVKVNFALEHAMKAQRERRGISKITYLLTYLFTYLFTYLLIYLLTYLLT